MPDPGTRSAPSGGVVPVPFSRHEARTTAACAAAASTRPPTQRFRRTLFAEANQIMRAEYGSDLRIDEVARRIATSTRQLQRAFLEAGGTTFRDHLCVVRMRAAAALLRDTELTVGHVARRVGYRQQAQFAKAFRRHAGLSPGEYRDRYKASRA